MSGILFLAHRVPFPPDRGDKIRSHHVLKALAELAPVHVACLAETIADKACEAELREVAATSCMPMRNRPLALAGLEAMARREPVSLAAFRHPALAAWVARTLEAREIDTIYVFSGQMGQYVPADWAGRLVVDIVDVDSAKFEAYAAEQRGPMAWVNAREARLLRREEARLASRADHTLLVSEAEAALFRSRLPPQTRARVHWLGNGIDADAFDPVRVAPHAALATDGPHLLFTGQMDYPPNVAAARRAIERLMPRLLARHPTARFHVVGRAPAPELLALEGVNGARIWGEVPDVRPFLAAADLMLAPLTIARGVQNKVLEAMAMARAVVLTSEAASGIRGEDGTHFAVADSDDECVRRTLALLGDRATARRIGESARRLVVATMSWPAMLTRLAAFVGRAPEPGIRRDAA
ncbi:MAG TPA: TIGR03087 family PEP-CTERM/XrtA system glycosyltransferase [Croceibacterium sp.]|nr:TIGR03087 family PEP-CTERM/XrtA system glycosyltransferase [Croceibacterium sp.]